MLGFSIEAVVNAFGGINGVLDKIMPKMAEQLSSMNRPVNEGGVLKEGEVKAAYTIIDTGKGPSFMVACYSFDEQNKRLYLVRTLPMNLGQIAGEEPKKTLPDGEE